jgi:Mn2+/Fe2+ NRAMP family transporter
MYALIIAIHAVFVFTAHLLGYRILEGVFVLLGIFFLFYFSPLFFIENEKKEESSL